MTEELFRRDSYLAECTATVTRVTERGVVTDQSVFYPEGGGQPGDRGVMVTPDNIEVEVIDTVKLPSGEIEHVLGESQTPPSIGSKVVLKIDWPYRYRHMRTHSCLHLLCSIIPYPVTGGSISQEKGRLDFDMSEPLDKAAVEAALQALVAADHNIGYRWISDAEMQANMELVRTMSVQPPMGQGEVRLVEIDGVDLQPCGGTHVRRSGEIGSVRLGKVEKKGKHNRRVNIHLD